MGRRCRHIPYKATGASLAYDARRIAGSDGDSDSAACTGWPRGPRDPYARRSRRANTSRPGGPYSPSNTCSTGNACTPGHSGGSGHSNGSSDSGGASCPHTCCTRHANRSGGPCCTRRACDSSARCSGDTCSSCGPSGASCTSRARACRTRGTCHAHGTCSTRSSGHSSPGRSRHPDTACCARCTSGTVCSSRARDANIYPLTVKGDVSVRRPSASTCHPIPLRSQANLSRCRQCWAIPAASPARIRFRNRVGKPCPGCTSCARCTNRSCSTSGARNASPRRACCTHASRASSTRRACDSSACSTSYTNAAGGPGCAISARDPGCTSHSSACRSCGTRSPGDTSRSCNTCGACCPGARGTYGTSRTGSARTSGARWPTLPRRPILDHLHHFNGGRSACPYLDTGCLNNLNRDLRHATTSVCPGSSTALPSR
jgi:hypothetical protein